MRGTPASQLLSDSSLVLPRAQAPSSRKGTCRAASGGTTLPHPTVMLHTLAAQPDIPTSCLTLEAGRGSSFTAFAILERYYNFAESFLKAGRGSSDLGYSKYKKQEQNKGRGP